MKYFIIFLLSFFFFLPAYAAKEVKGSIPQVQPLQPPAVGVGPNVNKNIQYQDPSRTIEIDSSDAQPAQTDTTVHSSGKSPDDSSGLPGNSGSGIISAAQEHGGVWVILILGFIGFAWWGYKKSKS